MTKFIIKGKVKYNGKLFNTGETVEVENKHIPEFKKYGWQIVDSKEPKAQEDDEGAIDYSKMNKAQIIAELQKRGVEFNKNDKKDYLISLLVQ